MLLWLTRSFTRSPRLFRMTPSFYSATTAVHLLRGHSSRPLVQRSGLFFISHLREMPGEVTLGTNHMYSLAVFDIVNVSGVTSTHISIYISINIPRLLDCPEPNAVSISTYGFRKFFHYKKKTLFFNRAYALQYSSDAFWRKRIGELGIRFCLQGNKRTAVSRNAMWPRKERRN